MVRKILIVLLIALFIIQFIPVDRGIPEKTPSNDFIALTEPPETIKVMLKHACYDCHSFQTRYPFYAYVAPVKFWLNDHIRHGRGNLNFSIWGEYDDKKQRHKLEEIVDEVTDGEMPLNSYTWVHNEARLTDVQVIQLREWIQNDLLKSKNE